MAKRITIAEKREAIQGARGGHENTRDSGIALLWAALDPATREAYLAAVAGKKQPRKDTKNDATSIGTERDV